MELADGVMYPEFEQFIAEKFEGDYQLSLQDELEQALAAEKAYVPQSYQYVDYSDCREQFVPFPVAQR